MPVFFMKRDALVQRDKAAGDGGGAGAAIGLQHVAVDDDLALAQRRQIARRRAASGRPAAGFPGCGRTACPAAASRRMRSWVERGSMPYSAVTQPLPEPLRKGGAFSSRLAVTSTWVSPNLTRQEPSAWRATPGFEADGCVRSSARAVGGRMGLVYLEVVGWGGYLAACRRPSNAAAVCSKYHDISKA